jgi:hypothetical protein
LGLDVEDGAFVAGAGVAVAGAGVAVVGACVVFAGTAAAVVVDVWWRGFFFLWCLGAGFAFLAGVGVGVLAAEVAATELVCAAVVLPQPAVAVAAARVVNRALFMYQSLLGVARRLNASGHFRASGGATAARGAATLVELRTIARALGAAAATRRTW